MLNKKKVYVAGHLGMVGAAVCRNLSNNDDVELITRTKAELNLLNQSEVESFLTTTRPDEVILCAAKVGGIYANNTYPADFIYQNLMIQNNVIHSAYLANVKKLLFLGSSCIYPKFASQPMQEESLMSGLLEPTNEPYAIAKITGIKMCDSYNRQYKTDFRSVMPTNLFGPGDNFNLKNSHVIPAMIRKFHDAKVNNQKEVVLWGDGSPLREFMHVDELASACIHVLNLPVDEYKNICGDGVSHLNIGSGEEVSIAELAEMIKRIVGYGGEISFDATMPNGTPRKLLDVSRMHKTGWSMGTDLEKALRNTYTWFIENLDAVRR